MTHPALFDKGSPQLPDNTQIFTGPRAASLSPTTTRQFSSGHCTTHAGAVRQKNAGSEFTPRLNPQLPSTADFYLEHLNSVIELYPGQRSPHFFEGCFALISIRTSGCPSTTRWLQTALQLPANTS